MLQGMRERGVPSMLGRGVHAHPALFSRVMPLSFRRAPLLHAAACFALGIVAARWWRPGSLLVVCTAVALTIAASGLRRFTRLATAVTLLAWLLLGWTVATLHPRSRPDRTLLPYADGLRRDVVATVLAVQPLTPAVEGNQDPQRYAEQAADQESGGRETAKYAVDLQLQQVEQVDSATTSMQSSTGRARLIVTGTDAAALVCGTEVRATARLYPPRQFEDPGVWRYSSWLADQQITAIGSVVAGRVTMQQQRAAPLPCRLQHQRQWAAGRLGQFAAFEGRVAWLPAALRWNADDVAAWSAMLFGDRTALTHTLRSDFERTGTFHLFVVSGMHVGLVAALLLWAARGARCGRLLTAVLTGAGATAYALLTGFGEPVQRALWMTLVFLLAQAIGRERNNLNAIGAAALGMLVVRPASLGDTGLQMTILIALTIAGIAIPLLERTIAPYARGCRGLHVVRIDRRLPPRVAQFRVHVRWFQMEMEDSFGRWAGVAVSGTLRLTLAVASATVVAMVTECTMALPMAVYFHRFTTFALPANLLVIPLLAPLMVCGMLTFVVSLISVHAALITALPAALLLHTAGWLVHVAASLHGADVRTAGPALLPALALAAVIAVSVALMRWPRRVTGWASVVAVCGVCTATVGFRNHGKPSRALEVAAIDVGQGDSILLVAPTGQTMLIDAGGIVGPEQAGSHNRANNFDTGEDVVSPYLWHRGIAQLDVLALSHAHMDHLGGMDAVLHNFRPRELWLSVEVPSPHLEQLVRDARAQGTTVRTLRAGVRLNWQQVWMEVMAPQAAYQPQDVPTNDDSIVLRAEYGQSSVLLAGDAEAASEDAMLASQKLRPVTLLKVGHHGSMTSTGERFVHALSPRYAVISCGRRNHFGHPRMPVLSRLEQQHTLTARTDTMGAVEYALYADGSVTTHFPAADED